MVSNSSRIRIPPVLSPLIGDIRPLTPDQRAQLAAPIMREEAARYSSDFQAVIYRIFNNSRDLYRRLH
jgi:hypothetical protein